MKKHVLILLMIVLGPTCLAQQNVMKLEGKWKVENKDTYEVWKANSTGLEGYSCKMKDGLEYPMESLSISKNSDIWVYEATVPTQNEGRTIPFKLNLEVEDKLSFENMNHDFPVKIQYTFVSDKRLFVNVLGSDGNGFSYYMDKTE